MYDPYPAAPAGLIGQDIVTLVLGLLRLQIECDAAGAAGVQVPGIVLWSGWPARLRLFDYYFLIGSFEPAVPGHRIVATSLYALLALLFRIDAEALRAIAERAPVRVAASFLVVTALLFAVMWGGLSVASALTGTAPGPVVHLVVAIDGAVLLPLLFWGGVGLWRRQPWGYLRRWAPAHQGHDDWFHPRLHEQPGPVVGPDSTR